MTSRRRIAITGLGSVTGFGVGFDSFWQGMLQARSCIRPIARFRPDGFRCRLAAEVLDFSAKDFVPKHYRKAVKVMARDIELAVAAARDAVLDAKLVTRGTSDGADAAPTYAGERMGCHVGAALIAAEAEELTTALATARAPGSEQFDLARWGDSEGGQAAMNNLQPLWLLKYLPNMLACHVTIIHGCEGPSNTITCADASGLLSLGESARVIERGDADACLSGGAQTDINHMSLMRLELTRRVAETGDATDPRQILKPFSPASRGGLVGEAGAIVVLEDLDRAVGRGARVYAELAGFGAAQSSAPAYPPFDSMSGAADGLSDAIESALRDAHASPEEIDAIVPHAAGLTAWDRAEADAIVRVFGERAGRLPLFTITPNTGDGRAASGVLGVALAAKILSTGQSPARLGVSDPILNLLAGDAPAGDATHLRTVLVCTPSEGGHHAAVVLRRVG